MTEEVQVVQVQWHIPPRVWLALISMALGLALLLGLFTFWIWYNDRQQDRAMCTMLDLSTPSPEVVATLTPEQQAILKAMMRYRSTLDCPS
jgi:hypothetical protein